MADSRGTKRKAAEIEDDNTADVAGSAGAGAAVDLSAPGATGGAPSSAAAGVAAGVAKAPSGATADGDVAMEADGKATTNGAADGSAGGSAADAAAGAAAGAGGAGSGAGGAGAGAGGGSGSGSGAASGAGGGMASEEGGAGAGGESRPGSAASNASSEARAAAVSARSARARQKALDLQREEAARQAELDREMMLAVAERKAIEDGTDMRLEKEFKAYELRKRVAVRTAEAFAEWRLASVKAQLEYERAAATDVCKNARKAAVDSYLASVDEKIRRIQERKAGMRQHYTSRKLRSKNQRGGGDDSNDLSSVPNPNKPFPMSMDPPIQSSLADDAVLADLKEVHANWLSQAKKFRRSAPAAVSTPIRLERGRLVCDGEVFERGELVMVTSEITHQPFYGSITSLGSIEVGIRLSDGTRSRVPISMLQQGRCRMRHQQQ